MRRRLPILAAALGFCFAVPAAAAPTAPVYDAEGRLVETPFVPVPAEPVLAEEEAIELALAEPKIASWVERYPAEGLTERATFDDDKRAWTVKVWSDLPEAGQIALAKVDDATRSVTEAWTGPQVAWTMARGYDGAFGRKINDPAIWWPLCAVFFLGLANLRRPLSLRNLDLLVLLSFAASWWLFNDGRIFWSVPAAYPPLVYLLARMAWVGVRGSRRDDGSRPLWPVWVLAAATVFLAGFRIGLNVEASNVIDVGYAGVIGAQRIVSAGEMPYGHMPVHEGEECGAPDVNGNVRDRIQTNGRCESANDRGDTYGPITYIAYIPGYLAFGWSGKWDSLPAAHLTSILFDCLALVGLALVGWRFGRGRLAATLPFAWAAYPFTQYVSSSNSNDAILPAILIFGFWLLTSAPARGLATGLASWAKFASLLLVPLWLSYPDGLRRPRALAGFAGGFALATVLGFWVFLLEPDPLHAARVFWDRTFGFQLGRDSPFSIWNWGEYPGYPDLGIVQTAIKAALVAGAVALAFRPRHKSPLQLAALSAALLAGFQLVLTHWFYLYLPWVLPFVAFALYGPVARQERAAATTDERDLREPAGASV
ncbi:MAG: DUF2029 domain-containing protein [Thermoleophilia bacterium]|nr:DUF2029 domain-containing protein [Thermoleophilia bacterium]